MVTPVSPRRLTGLRPHGPRCLALAGTSVLALACAVAAHADDADRDDLFEPNSWYPSLTYQGQTGLIDMPSARMQPDGNLVFGGAGKEPDQRAFLTFQATPWAQGTFRYSHIQGFLEQQPNFYDRSFALKLRLVKESKYLPAIAVGMNDLLGTGIYGGEYVAASKRFGDLDATIGVGWGRFGQSGALGNPLTVLSSRFENRDTRSLADTGQFDVGSYFAGSDMGVFGGIEYSPPVKALETLKLQLEYSSDRYDAERAAPLVRYNVRSPINLGVTYEPLDGVEVGAHYLYGNTVGIRFAFKTDPRKRIPLPRFDAEPPDFRVRPEQARRAGFDSVTRAVPAAPYDPMMPVTVQPGAVSPARLRFGPGATVSRDMPTPLDVTEGVLADDWHLAARTDLCLTRAPGRESAACVTAPAPVRTAPAPAEAIGPAAADVPDALEGDALYDAISEAADEIYLSVTGIDRRGRILTVFFVNRRYDRSAEALGRMTRVLTQEAPDEIEVFELVLQTGSLPVTTAVVPRAELERLILSGSSPEEIAASITLQPAARGPSSAAWTPPGQYPSFGVGVSPGFRQSLFDPDDPFRYQFLLRLNLNVGLARGVSFNTSYALNLYNNFDEIVRESDSQLPRVRSDFARYLQEGDSGIETMGLNSEFKLAPEVYGRVSAGLLEEMFAGVGGEVLYRPFGKSWAVGANVYGVQQRDFNKLFDLRDYRTVTGHASLYLQTGYHGLQFNMHAGRYLARDYGATFEVKRRFDTGVEVGAFATFTDVPFDEFGEGSFDKGLVLRIPFGWFTPYATKRQYNVDLRPLTRDGGQRLLGSTVLYDATLEESAYEIERNWDGFVD